MKVKKTIKKIVALGVGASMLGATVLGAMAADLGDYPSPLFIEGGEFMGSIVLGDNAISADTLGAIDIATGLQYSGGASEVTVDDGVAISASGDEMNVNESIYDVDTALDGDDLPTILADGIFEESEGNNDNDQEYTQELAFFDGTGVLQLTQDDDDAPDGGLYVVFERSNSYPMYNYTLEFDDYMEFDNTSSTTTTNDLETAKIEIQGQLYTITSVKAGSDTKIDKLTLQAGDTTVWLEQGTPITRIVGGEEHEVELVDVNENEDKCGIMVDTTLQWVDKGSSKKVNGVEIGVTDAIVVHSETKDTDVCEVNLGATEVEIEDGKEVEINGKDIDGSKAQFKESNAGQLEEIYISYVPEDKIYLSEGDSVADPVLGNFEFSFANLNAKLTEMDISVSGDDTVLTFNNVDGKEVKLPFYCSGNCDSLDDIVYFGTSADAEDRYYFAGGICAGTSSVTDCEGARFLVEEGKELHVIELDDIDLSDNKTTLKDITYGGSKTTSNSISGSEVSMSLPAGGSSVGLSLDTAAYTVTLATTGIVKPVDTFYTEYEGLIALDGLYVNGTTAAQGNTTNVVYNVSIYVNETEGEVDSTSGNEDSRNDFYFTLYVDTDDDEFNVKAPTISSDVTYSAVDKGADNNDDRIYYTNYGTKVEYDNENKRSAKVWFPEEELSANVFVAPVGATVVGGGMGGASKKIEVGTAKLASEVASLSAQNTVIVGGPCANEKAAEFLGVTQATCAEGAPEANTAVIKLKEYGDYVAMLVNGYDAIDTRRASRVLANYGDYDLSGDEVVVSGTDFSNIVVATVE